MTKATTKKPMRSLTTTDGRQAHLIPIMQDIQEEYRYLPGELLTYVAKEIGVTEAKAYSVATFYEILL